MSRTAESRIGAAPICWGVCHIEGWGYQMTPERVFDEMRRVGVAATETVPHGWLPEDPQEARDLLKQWGIQITSGYVPLVLYRGEDAWREELKTTGTWLAELGAEVLMIGALDESETYDRRPELSDEDWESLLSGLDAASDAAKELGLTAALHPHLGTTVERAEDIERVLDGSKISFCLDTGHIYIGGADPGDLARRAADRIAYVHLKDVDPVVTERYRSGELDFLGAVREGIFLPLGKGAVDIASVVQPLVAHGYSGWYMIEQDVMLQNEPAPGEGPTADTQWSKRALERIVSSMGSAL